MRFDNDRMNNAPSAAVAHHALDLLTKSQDERMEVQVLGMAAAFLSFCGKKRVDPAEVMRAAQNMLSRDRTKDPAFVALDMYMQHEVA